MAVPAFLQLQQQLLRIEEQKQAEHYERMDVFNTVVTSARHGTFTLTVDVPGLQEQHPPVATGDLLMLRLRKFPDLEISLRVVNVDRRTMLIMKPSTSRAELLDLARQIAGPYDSGAASGVDDIEKLVRITEAENLSRESREARDR